jgi:uncharacterized protein
MKACFVSGEQSRAFEMPSRRSRTRFSSGQRIEHIARRHCTKGQYPLDRRRDWLGQAFSDRAQSLPVSNAVTHFEIYAEHPVELADFYRSLFGWQLDKVPGVDYWRVQTGAKTANGFVGGLTYRPFPGPRSWVHYVNVESLDDAVARVQQLGGAMVRPKTAVPKTAWYAVLADPEGNIFAVWQPDPMAFPPPEPD